MTTFQAVDMIQHHLGRIRSSVLSNGSVALYLCDTDKQDLTLYHLKQAGEILVKYPDASQSLALSDEDAEWVRTFYHMTAEELDSVDHSALWRRIYALIPLVA